MAELGCSSLLIVADLRWTITFQRGDAGEYFNRRMFNPALLVCTKNEVKRATFDYPTITGVIHT